MPSFHEALEKTAAERFPGLTQPDPSYHGLVYTQAFGYHRDSPGPTLVVSPGDELRIRLDAMLEREGRTHLAVECFHFLPTRAALDLGGWEDQDIFAH